MAAVAKPTPIFAKGAVGLSARRPTRATAARAVPVNSQRTARAAVSGICTGAMSGAASFRPAHGITERIAAVRRTTRETRGRVVSVTAEASDESGSGGFLETLPGKYAHLGVSLGGLLYLDSSLKAACAAASIKFPSPLIGMFGILAALTVTNLASPGACGAVQRFFKPALDWLARWLPLFYVPSLVVLPMAVNGIPGGDLTKILAILCGGMVASLVVTAQAAVAIRKLVNTPMGETEVSKPAPPFSRAHQAGWALVAAASIAAVSAGPSLGLPLSTAELARPGMLAGTVGGLLLGSALPKSVRGVLHPIIVCAACGNAMTFLMGSLTGAGYFGAMKMYLNKGAVGFIPGAGDVLMSFLGSVILSFGFRIFEQRKLMVRHAAEIFGCTTVSAAFSLFATAFVGRAVGLSSDLVRAIIPRSVTVALAMPIATLLDASNISVTAAAVVLTGLLGANFCQALLNTFGFKDPITRGLSTAGCAHGLGTAALAASEPEALPFCALAYALIGIISSVLVAVPPVRAALMAIAGV